MNLPFAKSYRPGASILFEEDPDFTFAGDDEDNSKEVVANQNSDDNEPEQLRFAATLVPPFTSIYRKHLESRRKRRKTGPDTESCPDFRPGDSRIVLELLLRRAKTDAAKG